MNLTRTRALWILAAITAAGGALRFYNLAWGAPYYHFHIDEHYVLNPADMMRRDMRETAMSGKFFMYSPLLMYLINIVRTVYEAVSHPLNLAVPRDQVTYMVLGRSISAAFGTATIPLVYAVGTRVSGRLAGLLSAAFLAFAVLHVRDSHFASTDISMVFFTVLALWCALRLVERGDLGWLVASGIAVGVRGGLQVHRRVRARRGRRRLSTVAPPPGNPPPLDGLGLLGTSRHDPHHRGGRDVLHPRSARAPCTRTSFCST